MLIASYFNISLYMFFDSSVNTFVSLRLLSISYEIFREMICELGAQHRKKNEIEECNPKDLRISLSRF